MRSVQSGQEPIAVVGMACRLPKADHLQEFWRLVASGRSAAGPLPSDRFDRALYYDARKGVLGKSYTDRACLVRYPGLDAKRSFWSEEVVQCPEPAFLTLFEVALAACRHAGWDAHALSGVNGGVYVGHTRKSGLSGDAIYHTWLQECATWLAETKAFHELGLQDELIRALVAMGREGRLPSDRRMPQFGANWAAGIIARGLELTGPYMAFNSACASSLYAVAQGMRALQRRSIDLALVGGASYCHVDTLILFSQAQSVSATDSRPFDAQADGLVVGEGYVVLALKRLRDALADGDRPCAVLRGVGLSSDGRGKSLWAPRKEGQILAVRRAYGDQLDPARLQYLEAHATSTQLGDATEIAAMAEALEGMLPPGKKIPVASVKANIGHTLETAGIAGLLKTVLAIENRLIPPAANVTRLNPKIAWDKVPFEVPLKPIPWPAPPTGVPRRAAVNAFGIGGLNAHLVVDEYLDGVDYYEAERPPGADGSGRGARAQPPAGENGRRPPRDETRGGLQEAVAIVGLGAILPGALSVEAYWDLLASGKSALTRVPTARWSTVAYRNASPPLNQAERFLGGFVAGFQYDWKRHKIPPKQVAHASPLQFMILSAVEEALRQAGYDRKPFPRERTGVVVGTNFGGEFACQLAMGLRLPEFRQDLIRLLDRRGVPADSAERLADEYAAILLKRLPALLDETGSFTSSSLASRITKSFDLMGGGASVDAGFGSAFAALQSATDLLLSGDCDLMICVAGSEDMGPWRYENLYWRGMLRGSASQGPAVAREGCYPGEGCAAFLLKRLTDARAGGDHVLAIVRGIGAAASYTDEAGSRLAGRRAVHAAAVPPEGICFVEAVGIGCTAFDQAMVRAVHEVLSDASQPPPPTQGSIDRVGHLAGACGAVALLGATLELDRLQLPGKHAATRGCHQQGRRQLRAGRRDNAGPHVESTAAGRAGEPPRMFASVHVSAPHECTYHVVVERGSPVKIQPDPASLASHSQNGTPVQSGAEGEVLYFDATARRRERLRRQSQTKPAEPAPSHPARSPAGVTARPPAAMAPSPATPALASGIRVGDTDGPPPAANPATDGGKASARRTIGPNIETFLIDFVVEQTGYPPEIVDLQADLEADLGIDSIKKAQLFGELREHFQIDLGGNESALSLDDFPTLGHVKDFLLRAGQGVGERPVTASTPPAAPSEAQTPAPAAAPQVSISEQELETFLIDFVVEQTGYPPEIVDLQADLEADLGIDSIKKAQLFGELREHFQIDLGGNESALSLDDFPTLGHVKDFLLRAGQGVGERPVTASTPPAAPSEAQTPAPAAAPQVSISEQELETFLIDFVVEQTGYPPEIVDLQADLEADLGIDSIKKAQLFGELREHFQIDLGGNESALSLDDFPTLGHVKDYLLAHALANR